MAKRLESSLESAREFVRKRLPEGFSSRDFNPTGIIVRLLLSAFSELASRYSFSYQTESMSISFREGSAYLLAGVTAWLPAACPVFVENALKNTRVSLDYSHCACQPSIWFSGMGDASELLILPRKSLPPQNQLSCKVT